MQVGVSMWSYVSHVRQEKMDVLSFLDTVKELGADGVELLEFFWKDKEAELPKVLEKARALGLTIGSFAIGNDLSHPDEAERKAQVAAIKDGVDTAVALGTNRLRVFAGHHNEVGYEKSLSWIIEGLKEGAAYAEPTGVVLCLENHGTMAGRADQVKEIIEAVGSPALRANPDTGNFRTVGEDSAEAVAALAPITSNVHFKDFRWAKPEETEHVYEGLNGSRVVGTAIGDGDVDLPKVVQILRDSGYDGFLTIEYEGGEDPATALPRSVNYTRGLLEEGK